MGFSILALWIGRVPTVYYFAFVANMGSTGIWIGMALGNIVGAIVAALWFTRGTWKKTVIDEGEEPEETPAVDAESEVAEASPED